MISNIRLLIEACKDLNIQFEIIHPNENLVKVITNKRNYYFANYDTPFVSKIISEMFQYRDYSYHILKDIINFPKTKAFLSPFCQDTLYKDWVYSEYKDIDSLVEVINKIFSLPVLIKKTANSSANNVSFCKDKNSIKLALERIYQIDSDRYNYFALAREYIDIAHEYRAIFFNKLLFLVYEKSQLKSQLIDDISLLEWKEAKLLHITDENLISDIENFVQPIFKQIPISYGQFNVALDNNGNYWLTEIIPQPDFDNFINNNSELIIVELFKKMLTTLTSE